MFAKANSSDPEIIAALARGDKEAFRLLYDRHVTLLLNYGMSIASDRELVKDCVHDLYMNLWQRRDRLDAIESMQAYLLTSLRRMIIYKLKKQGKADVREHTYVAGHQEEETAEDRMIRVEGLSLQYHTIAEKVDQLPARQREVIFLRFFAEMDYEEIAAAMGLNYQGVRNLVYKAIRSLRGSLLQNDAGVLLFMAAFICLSR